MNRLDKPDLKTYIRRHKTINTIPRQSESPSPRTDHSSVDTSSSPIDDLNLLVALRKGLKEAVADPKWKEAMSNEREL